MAPARLRLLPGVLAACLALYGDDSFGNTLQLVLRAGKDRFQVLEGARIENRRREFYYEARNYLPGADYCRILRLETVTYACEWRPAAGRSPNQRFEELAARVGNALGAGWARQPGLRKTGADVVFTAANQPVVQVIRYAERPGVHVLVMPPGASPKGWLGPIPSTEDFAHP